MSDFGWRSDGIARARACGGVELEVYRRPGFAGGTAVRRVRWDADGGGYGLFLDPPPGEEAEECKRWPKKPSR